MAVVIENRAHATALRPFQSSENAEIRDFTFEVPEADLVDLRARIAATRWPERETVMISRKAFS